MDCSHLYPEILKKHNRLLSLVRVKYFQSIINCTQLTEEEQNDKNEYVNPNISMTELNENEAKVIIHICFIQLLQVNEVQ